MGSYRPPCPAESRRPEVAPFSLALVRAGFPHRPPPPGPPTPSRHPWIKESLKHPSSVPSLLFFVFFGSKGNNSISAFSQSLAPVHPYRGKEASPGEASSRQPVARRQRPWDRPAPQTPDGLWGAFGPPWGSRRAFSGRDENFNAARGRSVDTAVCVAILNEKPRAKQPSADSSPVRAPKKTGGAGATRQRQGPRGTPTNKKNR